MLLPSSSQNQLGMSVFKVYFSPIPKAGRSLNVTYCGLHGYTVLAAEGGVATPLLLTQGFVQRNSFPAQLPFLLHQDLVSSETGEYHRVQMWLLS